MDARLYYQGRASLQMLVSGPRLIVPNGKFPHSEVFIWVILLDCLQHVIPKTTIDRDTFETLYMRVELTEQCQIRVWMSTCRRDLAQWILP